jgi:replicative DNA helicase
MGPLELLRRITARATKTFLGRLKTGEKSPEEARALVRRAIATTPNLALVDATREPALPSLLLAAAEVIRGESPHLLIVVDSVHSWTEGLGSDGASEYDALNFSLASLRRLSSQLACPILAVAERNRVAMDKGGLSAGAGTRKLEYGAESLWDLKRQAEEREDAEREVSVSLVLEKNRNGAPGKRVPLKFKGATQTFREDV